jgi:uncharacterized protein (DUF58 family)
VTAARPTARGLGLLALAIATYLAARALGTWELYFLAVAFVAALGVCWALVAVSVRSLQLTRTITPEQPVAGDPLTLAFRVRNGSRLPGLQVTLVGAGAALGHDGGTIDVESLGPHAEREAVSAPWPARRGVHTLPPQGVIAEDPLGLVRARRSVGEALTLTVLPRLVQLPSWDVSAGAGTRLRSRRRRPPTVDASEFRGIRPHNPGEPLNRVDWKATARTGSLMLRELEDSGEGDVAILFNGPKDYVAGELPETNFETGVRVTGSIADAALRGGHRVAVLLPDQAWRPVRLAPGAASRRRLPALLARVRPAGFSQLGPSLRALVAGQRSRTRLRSLTLVVLSLDRALVRAVAALREEGMPVCVIDVRGGRTEAGASAGDDELRRALAAAGVAYIVVRGGDDLSAALTAPRPGRRALAQ